MAIIDEVKQRLRISHAKLDADLSDTIEAARNEMIRVGVDARMAMDDDDPLIKEAIKTYAQQKFTDDEKEQEGFYNSWVVQVDGLRKSRGYRKEVSDAE